jgi:hypothetical protein
VEQLRDDGQHPGEVAGPTAPSSCAPSGPGSTVVVVAPCGVHVVRSGSEDQLDTLVAADLQVRLQGARIAREVSLGPNCRGLTKIDTATTPAPGMRRACRISSRWPSCSAPIVGTSATRLPAVRSARVTGVIAAGPGVDGELAGV